MPQLRNIFWAGAVLIFTRILRAPKRRHTYVFISLFIFSVFSFLPFSASAIVGPSCAPTDANCGGSLSVDANRNLGFNVSVVGTTTGATPPFGNFSKVFMIAATSSPPGLGLRSVASGCPLEGCNEQPLYPATWVWRLTPWGFMELVNATDSSSYNAGPVITFGGGSTYNRRVTIGNFYSATSSMSEALNVVGNVKGNSFVGNLSGSVSAGNVTGPSAFGINYGTYNFASPGAFAIGTSTTVGLPSNGLYVVGNVGIGTATPGYKLDVNGSARIDGNLYVGTTGSNGDLRLIDSNGYTWRLNSGVPSNTYFSIQSWATESQTDANAVNRLVIDNSGNVGIGTTAPGTKLDVNGSVGISPNTAGKNTFLFGTGNADQGRLKIYEDTTERIRLLAGGDSFFSTGNVGIGTTTPTTAKLVVASSTAGAAIDVVGGRIINVGTPTGSADAATKSYVDSVVGGGAIGSWLLSGNNLYTSSTSWNIGIGTTAPGYKLDVAQGNAIAILVGADTTGTTRTDATAKAGRITSPHYTNAEEPMALIYGYSAGTSQNDVNIGGGTGLANAATGIHLYTATNGTTLTGTERMTIISSGNVGIGTTAPGAKLEVNGIVKIGTDATTGQLLFGTGSQTKILTGSNFYQIQNWDGAAYQEVFYAKQGNVGISTTTPSYKLDVVGTSQFSQPVIVGTPTANTHATTKSYVDSLLTGGSSDGSFNTIAVTGTSTLATTGGRVGIGTTSPGEKLDVAGNIKSTGGSFFTAANYYLNGNAYMGGSGGSVTLNAAGTNQNISLTPSGTGYTILNGNVGIGTTSPSELLDVQKGNDGGVLALSRYDTNNAVANGDLLGSLVFKSNTGEATQSTFAKIDGNADSNTGLNDRPSRLSFWTIPDGSGTLAERMRIDNAGNVGIATTTPSYKLDVVGGGQFSQPVIVGTPTANTHATTKSYVDSMFTGSGQWTTNGGLVYLTSTTQNVGIGTTSPTYKLQVDNGGSNSFITVSANTGKQGTFESKSGTNIWQIGNQSDYLSGSLWFRNAESGTPLVLIQTGGNVGIGTTAPGAKLDVESAGTAGVGTIISRIVNTGSNDAGTEAQLALQVSATTPTANSVLLRAIRGDGVVGQDHGFAISTTYNGALSEALRIRPNGNVGIGTSTPSDKLHLAPVVWDSNQDGGIKLTDIGNHFIYRIALKSDASGNSRLGFDTGNSGVATEKVSILNGGNVGISTTTPSYKLDVVGTSQFSQPVIVGTPTTNAHAATKSYVDSIVGGGAGTGSFSTLTVSGTSTLSGNWQLGGAALGNVNMNGFNIVGVNKITASVIDPIYSIDGIKYATYGSDTIGIKTGIFGKAKLTNSSKNEVLSIKYGEKEDRYLIPGIMYSATLDFSSAEKGSDLWLFWQTINAGQNMKDITVSLTPEFDGRTWYELRPAKKQIVIYAEIQNSKFINQSASGQTGLMVSYHITAPRHDASQWGNRVKDQKEGASFILRTK